MGPKGTCLTSVIPDDCSLRTALCLNKPVEQALVYNLHYCHEPTPPGYGFRTQQSTRQEDTVGSRIESATNPYRYQVQLYYSTFDL
jgi:hypothetical protein